MRSVGRCICRGSNRGVRYLSGTNLMPSAMRYPPQSEQPNRSLTHLRTSVIANPCRSAMDNGTRYDSAGTGRLQGDDKARDWRIRTNPALISALPTTERRRRAVYCESGMAELRDVRKATVFVRRAKKTRLSPTGA